MQRNDPNISQFRLEALQCPLPQAVELIGEKWTFLILRGAFRGLKHFEQYQAGLGIARNILSERLSKLVAGGILSRLHDPADRRRIIYSLTAKGEALLPAMLALRQWAGDWGYGRPELTLVDKRDMLPVRRMTAMSADGRELQLRDIEWAKPVTQPARGGPCRETTLRSMAAEAEPAL